MIVFCIVAWGAWAVTQRMALRYMTPVPIQLVTMFAYTVLAPLVLLTMKVRGVTMTWSTTGIVWSMASCVLVLCANLCFLVAISRMPAYLVTSFTSVYPAFTVLLCWLFLGEQITSMKTFGISMIIAGIVVVTR